MMFRTRDLGRWTPDGELEHLGRTDDQVKVRGFRVELDSVSPARWSSPRTAPAPPRPARRAADRLRLPGDVDVDAARRSVARSLPYYCVPSRVVAVAALPVTNRGKVDKAPCPT